MKKNEKKVTKKKKEVKDKSSYIKIALVSVILIFLIGLIVYARNFRNFSNIYLRTNNKDIFNVKDLVIGDIKYLDNEQTIVNKMGKPKKESTIVNKGYVYKIYKYDGLKLTLKENYSDYVLVGAETTSRKYATARKIRVGNKITKVLKKYRVDNKKGTYMYGKYSRSALNDLAVTKDIYLGYREKDVVEYINRDAVTDKKLPVMKSNIKYEYKYGKIKKISWLYDVE